MLPRLLIRALVLCATLSGLAPAQQFPLQLRASSGNQIFIIANQSTLAFTAQIGQSQTVVVTATYTGSGTVNVAQAPQVFGSTEFTAVLSGKLPLVLNPGDSLSFSLVFRPANAELATAIFNLPFTETVPNPAGNQTTTTTNAIGLSLTGTAASFVLSYTKGGNVVPLPTGAAMVFDPQPINTTLTLALNITNNGSATGVVSNISITGKAFKLVGLPLFPSGVQAGQTLQVGVEYAPTAVASDTGQVQITLPDGTNLNVALQGSGTAPALVYTLVQNGKTTTITPGSTVPLPDTDIGNTNSIVLRVQNTGNGSATIGSINVAGQAFQLTGLPLLPKTLNTNDSFTFTITFAPFVAGVANGQLLVGTDLFDLTGKGLGSQLQFSYAAGGSTLILGQNGVTAVVFSPVQITQTEPIVLTTKNIGTLPAVISNIAVGETNSPFQISGLPKLPLSLAPGASATLTVSFAPTTVGLSSGTLLINTASIPLSGSATAPPPLPAYTISGPTGNVAAQTQPGVSLKLAKAYPLAINGVLTLTTSGTLGSDPAVQFSTGGRTVPFTIPANGTDANFAGQGTQILLQTGTVASTVTLTPSFATASGVNLTPTNPTTLQFTVPSAAPVLIAAVEAASTANGVVLDFTGYSTTRTLTSLNVQFTAATGFTLASSQVTVDLHESAIVWFQSTAAQSFGGQFTVSVPFTFSGTVPTGKTLLQTIASFSATISNEVGASNSVSAPIQ